MSTASSVSVSDADLVDLDQDRVGDALLDALLQALGVGDEEIVADELYLLAERFGHRGPAVPIVFGHAVLDRDDRIARAKILVELDHAGRIERLALAFQLILAVLEELGRSRIDAPA